VSLLTSRHYATLWYRIVFSASVVGWTFMRDARRPPEIASGARVRSRAAWEKLPSPQMSGEATARSQSAPLRLRPPHSPALEYRGLDQQSWHLRDKCSRCVARMLSSSANTGSSSVPLSHCTPLLSLTSCIISSMNSELDALLRPSHWLWHLSRNCTAVPHQTEQCLYF